MSKKSKKSNKETKMDKNQKNKVLENDDQVDLKEEQQKEVENGNGEEPEEEISEKVDEVDQLKVDLEEAKDKYLRLYSEFENFRRRTAKERLDLISSASADLMSALLPVIDDFERAHNAFDEKSEAKTVKEGYDLIYNKLKNIIEQKGLKAMDLKAGDDFDPEFHEAITQIPAPEDKLKGKIVDVIEKGYLLNDKVVRFAKVVTGS